MSALTAWLRRTAVARCFHRTSGHMGSLSAPGSAAQLHVHTAQHNSNRSSVVRCGRTRYERLYPVLLVRPDGSTIHIRYKEPRKILLMPVDVFTLTEEQRKARQKKKAAKQPTKKTEIHYEDDSLVDKYSQFWKKK